MFVYISTSVCLFISLLDCLQNNAKSYGQILMNVLPEVCLSLTHIPIYFGGDPDHLANTPNLTNILLKDVTDEI